MPFQIDRARSKSGSPGLQEVPAEALGELVEGGVIEHG
jgi:hypothetical protein